MEIQNHRGSGRCEVVVREPVGVEILNHRGSGRREAVVREPVGWRFRTTKVPAGVRWWFENQ